MINISEYSNVPPCMVCGATLEEHLEPHDYQSNVGEVSDGYHTFNELYDHRIELFIALCRWIRSNGIGPAVWRSRKHSDGSMFDGWFVAGIDTVSGRQITYHLPIGRWGDCEFMQTLDAAPEWDGHTPADVLDRLRYV